MEATSRIARDILDRAYVRRLTPDPSGGYVASISEFPGCIAEGETAEEALQNLDKAAESWIEVAIANGREIREPVDFDGFSGKTALRMPRNLHKQAAELAELEGCSLNQLLVTAISFYVGGKQAVSSIEAYMQPAPTFASAVSPGAAEEIHFEDEGAKKKFLRRIREAGTTSAQSQQVPVSVGEKPQLRRIK
jgi:predicted RNase H-like HicB family nuclease